jgi:hypothetical protein
MKKFFFHYNESGEFLTGSLSLRQQQQQHKSKIFLYAAINKASGMVKGKERKIVIIVHRINCFIFSPSRQCSLLLIISNLSRLLFLISCMMIFSYRFFISFTFYSIHFPHSINIKYTFISGISTRSR